MARVSDCCQAKTIPLWVHKGIGTKFKNERTLAGYFCLKCGGLHISEGYKTRVRTMVTQYNNRIAKQDCKRDLKLKRDLAIPKMKARVVQPTRIEFISPCPEYPKGKRIYFYICFRCGKEIRTDLPKTFKRARHFKCKQSPIAAAIDQAQRIFTERLRTAKGSV